MFEENAAKLNTRRLAVASLLLALSVMINYFRVTIPVGGAPVLRISPGGPFLRYIGILFGPLYGGIAFGLSDLIGFVLKPENGFIWPLTVVEILKGAAIAWLWQKLRNTNFKVYNKFYVMLFILLVITGSINYIAINYFPQSVYTEFISIIGKDTDYVGIGLIIAGFTGLFLSFIVLLLRKIIRDTEFFVNYLILIIAIGMPCLLATTVNTFILKSYLFLPDRAIIFLWLPRIIKELIMVLYNTYVICFLMNLPLRVNLPAKHNSYEK